MTQFTYHTVETAPDEARPMVEQSQSKNGLLPNLHAVMAEAPGLLEGYQTLWGLFGQTSLSPLEQHVVMMTANIENDCRYCVPWHTLAMTSLKMPAEVIEALRNETPLEDAKLEALRTFTRGLIEHRGHIGDLALEAFLEAGYTQRQALEVVLGLSVKLLSNYTNALAHTELDEPPKRFAWTPSA